MISVIYYKINPVHIFFYVLFLYVFHTDMEHGIPLHCQVMNAAGSMMLSAFLSVHCRLMTCQSNVITVHFC